MKIKNFSLSFVLLAAVVFAVAASRKPFYADAGTYITKGTCVCTADGTVTNTFTTPFSSAPTIVTTQIGTLVTGTNIISSVTASNFVLNTKAAAATITNSWIAIGAP